MPAQNQLSAARCHDKRRHNADEVITATMIGGKNTLGYLGQFIYTMRHTRVRRSYTGYYPSLPS